MSDEVVGLINEHLDGTLVPDAPSPIRDQPRAYYPELSVNGDGQRQGLVVIEVDHDADTPEFVEGSLRVVSLSGLREGEANWAARLEECTPVGCPGCSAKRATYLVEQVA